MAHRASIELARDPIVRLGHDPPITTSPHHRKLFTTPGPPGPDAEGAHATLAARTTTAPRPRLTMGAKLHHPSTPIHDPPPAPCSLLSLVLLRTSLRPGRTTSSVPADGTPALLTLRPLSLFLLSAGTPRSCAPRLAPNRARPPPRLQAFKKPKKKSAWPTPQ